MCVCVSVCVSDRTVVKDPPGCRCARQGLVSGDRSGGGGKGGGEWKECELCRAVSAVVATMKTFIVADDIQELLLLEAGLEVEIVASADEILGTYGIDGVRREDACVQWGGSMKFRRLPRTALQRAENATVCTVHVRKHSQWRNCCPCVFSEFKSTLHYLTASMFKRVFGVMWWWPLTKGADPHHARPAFPTSIEGRTKRARGTCPLYGHVWSHGDVGLGGRDTGVCGSRPHFVRE